MTDASPRRSANDSPIKVTILPHTHWDREWYAPFQDFRHRLVRLLDEFLPRLEADPSYEHFLLDGQTAVIDDYLEVRPEASEILTRLGKSGRLGIGPWAILMDEYMVSGETIIRNLQMGIARAEDFGGAMKVGYLPDMFGHVAQMPQILKLAGLDQAVVWRGVPSAIQKTAFWWEALDGSRVRAEFLVGSYSNGRDLPSNPATLVQRAHNYANELGDARYPGGGILFMNGTDHQVPQPWLGAVVASANAEQSEYRFEVNSLAAYLAEQTSENLPTWRGEMRSGARANVLMGVASNRVDIHQACAAAERIIERRAEPLQALHLPVDRYATAEMDIAWRQLILNSAHDSSCACSADDVVDAVMVRYREALHIGEGLTREALDSLANRVSAPSGSVIVANATATQRDGVVICLIAGDSPMHLRSIDGEQPCPTQQLHVLGGEVFSTTVTSEQIPNSLEMVRGPEFAGTLIERFEIEVLEDDSVDVRAFAAAAMGKGLDLEDLRDQV
ncbi:MAG: alpha-mannosidase, partial [Actinomycetes bacterium]